MDSNWQTVRQIKSAEPATGATVMKQGCQNKYMHAFLDALTCEPCLFQSSSVETRGFAKWLYGLFLLCQLASPVSNREAYWLREPSQHLMYHANAFADISEFQSCLKPIILLHVCLSQDPLSFQ